MMMAAARSRKAAECPRCGSTEVVDKGPLWYGRRGRSKAYIRMCGRCGFKGRFWG